MPLWFGLPARCMCDARRAERLTRDVAINVALVKFIFREVFDRIRGPIEKRFSISERFRMLCNRPDNSPGPARHDHDTRKDHQRGHNCVPAYCLAQN